MFTKLERSTKFQSQMLRHRHQVTTTCLVFMFLFVLTEGCKHFSSVFVDLMGMFDRRRFRKLLLFALNFEEHDPHTYQDMDPHRTTVRDVFRHFDLGVDVVEFIGHALALHGTDE